MARDCRAPFQSLLRDWNFARNDGEVFLAKSRSDSGISVIRYRTVTFLNLYRLNICTPMSGLDPLEEKLILERARKGEREGFAEIYDFYAVKIYRFIYLRVNRKEDAQDLTSEVFLKSWRHLSRKKVNNLKSLLYQTARNLVIDFYRQNKGERRESVSLEEVQNTLVDKKGDLLEKVSFDSEIERVKKSLSRLKSDYQEVIILRCVEEFSFKEIAGILGKSEGSARVLSHRALKALKEELGK